MRRPHSKALAALALCAIMAVASYSSVSAKTKASTDKFSVVQQGQSTVFVVTNNTKKAKKVDLEFDIVNAQGRTEHTVAENDQTVARGASVTYNIGSLMLTPAASPYHVVFSVFKDNKKHKLIQTIDPAGSFTVVH